MERSQVFEGIFVMTDQLTYPHIEKVDGEVARLERLPRIRVTQLVMDYIAHGWSPDEMCRQHPYLSLAEAHAAMAYYYDNQEEIDNEIEQELSQIDQFAATTVRSPLIQRLLALRGR